MTDERERTLKAELLLEYEETLQKRALLDGVVRDSGEKLLQLGGRLKGGQFDLEQDRVALDLLVGLPALIREASEIRDRVNELAARKRAVFGEP